MPPSTRLLVRSLQAANPCWTYAQIGVAAGVSKQRVHQLVLSECLTHRPKAVVRHFTCARCGQVFEHHHYHTYCSPQCRHDAHNVPLVCDSCGKLFERRQSDVMCGLAHRPQYNRLAKGEHIFCSQYCHGYWLGKHHRSTRQIGQYRKHDWEMVWNEHLRTGYGVAKLSGLLGMPQGTVSSILWRTKRRKEWATRYFVIMS